MVKKEQALIFVWLGIKSYAYNCLVVMYLLVMVFIYLHLDF